MKDTYSRVLQRSEINIGETDKIKVRTKKSTGTVSGTARMTEKRIRSEET
jgi:hypothetical protein